MWFKLIYFIISISLLFGCAKQTAPTGGPKDEEPPVLISSNPRDQSLNFSGKTITLTFDEYVKLNSPTQQVLITPRIDQNVSYTNRRNRIIVEFEEKLAPNTTYNINFREAIQDITESNPASVVLAISTGDYLDSLSISGNIYDLLQGVPVKNAVVALQEPLDSGYYFMESPMYLAKSDYNGNFVFNNLKSSTFHIYAFTDANNDQKLQPSRELHGFLPELLTITSDTSDIYLPLISVNTDTLKLISARQAGRYFDITFNKYITDYSLTFDNQQFPYSLTDNNRVIRLYNTSTLEGSSVARINVTDSLEVTMNIEVPISYESTRREPVAFSINTKEFRIFKTEPILNTNITFTKPVYNVNPDSIFFFIDSLNIISLPTNTYSFDSSRSLLKIHYPLDKTFFAPVDPNSTKPGLTRTSPFLYFGKGAFISVEGDSSTQLKIQARQYDEASVGVLHLDVDVPYEYFIVELLNSKNEVVERRYNESKITFKNLIPATYMLRVLEDSDNDKLWEPGNIFWNTPPDDALFYFNADGKKDIVIRANWEVGPEMVAPVNNTTQ